MMWLLGGLTTATLAGLMLGLAQPAPPSLSAGWVSLLVSTATWGAALMAIGGGIGSVIQGLRALTAQDRATDRPPETGVSHLELGLVVLLAFAAIGLQLTLVKWVVEDAAISFAYAKHFAAGDGWVTYPGGERVEGYSNPLWTVLLSAFYVFGISGFTSNKIIAAACAAATVPAVWSITRFARPKYEDPTRLIAVILLVGSAQFTIWGAGGLENSLLNVLIALAVWRSLHETQRGGAPWSALLWLGVTLTRPEGILYAAIGGFWTMLARLRGRPEEGWPPSITTWWRRIRPTIVWLALFFIPFFLYQWWHYWYFAWELPNTYYAKKANPGKAFEPFTWTRKGWKYLRDWAHHLGHVYLWPVYLAGSVGTRGWRAWTCVAGAVVVGFFLLDPVELGFHDLLYTRTWWIHARVITLSIALTVPALLAIGRRGWQVVGMCQSLAFAALFFAVYAGGDWMNGFRWMATFAAPGAILLALGITEIASVFQPLDRDRPLLTAILGLGAAGLVTLASAVAFWQVYLPHSYRLGLVEDLGIRQITPWVLLGGIVLILLGIVLGLIGQPRRSHEHRWGSAVWTISFVLVVIAVVPNITRLDRFIARPTTSPWSVKRRVDYMNQVQRKLHLLHRPTTMDVDMGANMYWSDDKIVDIAGLVDVSMGHHWFDRPFVQAYIFDLKKPDFAHVHGGWASTSKLTTYPDWEEHYLEIPPYPQGRTTHPGNHIRKSLLLGQPGDVADPRRTEFSGEFRLEFLNVAGDRSSPGRRMYVEVGMSALRAFSKGENARIILFLSDDAGEVVQSWEVPPGFDYYKPESWSADEVVVSRVSLPIAEDTPLSTYHLGIALVRDPQGTLIPASQGPSQPHWLTGEARFDNAVTIVSADALDTFATGLVDDAAAAAEAGQCDSAIKLWESALRVTTWTDVLTPRRHPMHQTIAACWARDAITHADVSEQVASFQRALEYDHRTPTERQARENLAATLVAQGLEYRDQKRWADAHHVFEQALAIRPSLSWARRWALEAQDCHLGIRKDEHQCM